MRKTVTRLLLTVLVGGLVAGCHPLDNVMVDIFGRSMRDQRSFDPYENTRPEPPHVVSFASGNYPPPDGDANYVTSEGVDVPHFTQKDMLPVGKGDSVVQSLVNPGADSAALVRGDTLFLRFCAVCHGPDGIGKDAYVGSKNPVLAAYNLAESRVQGFADQYIYGMISVGRGLMPEYGSRIPSPDRWDIVNYLRTLEAAYNKEHPPQGGKSSTSQQGGN